MKLHLSEETHRAGSKFRKPATLPIKLLLTLLAAVFLLPVSAQEARLTIRMNNVALSRILDEIESQTKYNYIVRDNDIDLTQKVSISAENHTLPEVLDMLLKGKNITYDISNRNISIFKPQRSDASSRTRRITGTVEDVNGNPIAGVSVVAKGTSKGTATNRDGSFVLDIPGNPELEASFIGYQKQTVSSTGKTTFRIVLVEDIQRLDDVVVIGYGTMDKKELTSAISHISSDQFLNVGSADPLMQIQGKVAGVSITNQAAGDPNSSASVQIRGISSRSASNSPLVVIDGVPGGNMMNVNENDIQSIDILKDGAASAIYGTRGSNGVVLITTKKGAQDGKFHTSYSGYTTIDLPHKELRTMSADEFRRYRVPEGQIDYGGNTDWQDAITRNGWSHKHTLTLSGGNTRNNYRVSADYRKAEGIDLRSSREEYGARLSANHTTRNELFKFTVNAAPRYIDRTNSSWAVFRDALKMNPTMPIMDPSDSTLYFDTQIDPYNPVEKLKIEKDDRETKYLNWDITAKVSLLPLLMPSKPHHYLDTQITVSQELSDDLTGKFRPSTSTVSKHDGEKAWATRGYGKSMKNVLEWLINYSFDNRVHRVRFMGGYSYQYNTNSGLSAENGEFDNDVLTYNNIGNGMYHKEKRESTGMHSYKNDSKLIAFFGRVTYDYKQRYLATFSLRYEGSSRFGANHKWGYFPAASVGWVVSEESFMKNAKWIDQFKLRADIGVTGNQNFEDYRSLATMKPFGTYYYEGQMFNVWGWSKNVNPDLKWEKGVNWNVGVDFSFFSSRLTGSVNYYNRRQTDLLGTYKVPVPPNLFDETFVNVGSMNNNGIEVEVNVRAVNKKDFTYDIGFVGSSNRNRFLSFSNKNYEGQEFYDVCNMSNPNNPGNLQRIQVGESVGNFYTWAYAGVDSDGNWMVWNEDNTAKIPIGEAAQSDKRITGNGMPKFNMSITNTFRYKNLDLNIFIRGAFGFDLFNVHDFYYGLQSGDGNVLRRAYSKNYDVKTGMNQISDYFIEKGDYLKLDVVSLGYTFKMKNDKWLSGIRVYATAKNLYTFTKFTGVDPSTYPVNGLTPGTFGGDNRYYPSATQLLFGVQLDF